MKTKGTVWVLGASSGLGMATAQAFAIDGWLVVAGARSFGPLSQGENPSQKPTEPEETGGKGHMPGSIHNLTLDVQDETSCDRFIQEALAISPRVDVLCYAAGLLVVSPAEETSPAEYQRVMETNFIGMARMVGKALPLMRRQGSGKLVLFSSLNGLLGIPFQSAYTASKHAIEGYAQCLAMETRPLGVQVCVVQPGDHRGGSQKYRLGADKARDGSPYAKEYQSAWQTIRHDEAGGLFPEALGRKVVRNVNRKKMHTILRVARLDQQAAVWLHTLLPSGLFFSILRAYYVRKGS